MNKNSFKINGEMVREDIESGSLDNVRLNETFSIVDGKLCFCKKF